jgi:hypothetical protein
MAPDLKIEVPTGNPGETIARLSGHHNSAAAPQFTTSEIEMPFAP